MDGKQSWQRKQLFLYLTCVLVFFPGLHGCSELVKSKHSPPGRIRISNKPQSVEHIAEARQRLADGNYSASLEKLEEAIMLDTHSFGDRILYQMGLLYAHPENPDNNPSKSLEYFQVLQIENPESDLSLEAAIWVLVLQEILKQREELSMLYGFYDNETEKLKHNVDSLRSALANKKNKIKRLKERITSLNTEVEVLQNQIVQLKQIDIDIEEKKRQTEVE